MSFGQHVQAWACHLWCYWKLETVCRGREGAETAACPLLLQVAPAAPVLPLAWHLCARASVCFGPRVPSGRVAVSRHFLLEVTGWGPPTVPAWPVLYVGSLGSASHWSLHGYRVPWTLQASTNSEDGVLGLGWRVCIWRPLDHARRKCPDHHVVPPSLPARACRLLLGFSFLGFIFLLTSQSELFLLSSPSDAEALS